MEEESIELAIYEQELAIKVLQETPAYTNSHHPKHKEIVARVQLLRNQNNLAKELLKHDIHWN